MIFCFKRKWKITFHLLVLLNAYKQSADLHISVERWMSRGLEWVQAIAVCGASYSVFISVGTSWSIKPQNRGLYSNNVQNQDGCKKPVWVDRVADLASYLLLLSHITLKKANKSNKVMLKLFTFFLIDWNDQRQSETLKNMKWMKNTKLVSSSLEPGRTRAHLVPL